MQEHYEPPPLELDDAPPDYPTTPPSDGNRLSPMLGMNRKQRRAINAQLRRLRRH